MKKNARRTQTMGRKQVAGALTRLEGWMQPAVYLDAWEHYDVSDEGMKRADWLDAAIERGRTPYIVSINTGGYTGMSAAVVAGHPDEALETADEWAATRFYESDTEKMHEAGEGPVRVEELESIRASNPPRVIGFRFKVRDKAGKDRWALLQGSGGLMGNGALGGLRERGAEPERLAMVTKSLLSRARRELKDDGYLMEFLGDHLPAPKRHRRIKPASVRKVEPIFDRTSNPTKIGRREQTAIASSLGGAAGAAYAGPLGAAVVAGAGSYAGWYYDEIVGALRGAMKGARTARANPKRNRATESGWQRVEGRPHAWFNKLGSRVSLLLAKAEGGRSGGGGDKPYRLVVDVEGEGMERLGTYAKPGPAKAEGDRYIATLRSVCGKLEGRCPNPSIYRHKDWSERITSGKMLEEVSSDAEAALEWLEHAGLSAMDSSDADIRKITRAAQQTFLGAHPTLRNPPRTTLANLSWHNDPLVNDIGSQVDDRSLAEIGEAVMEIYEQYDRNIGESKATTYLTKEQAVDAAVLASQIVDWANYGDAYNDYSSPPWERENNPADVAPHPDLKWKVSYKQIAGQQDPDTPERYASSRWQASFYEDRSNALSRYDSLVGAAVTSGVQLFEIVPDGRGIGKALRLDREWFPRGRKRNNPAIKVEIKQDGMGNVTATPVSERVRAKVEKHLAQFGESGAEVFLQEHHGDEFLEENLTPAQRRDVKQGWGTTILVDPYTYGMWRGWDVSEVQINPADCCP